MPYTKSYRTIIPVEPGADLEVLRWLTRESFENAAGSMGLAITEYAEREVPWLDLPPKAAEHLPLRADEYTWLEFSAVGVIPEVTIEWLTAESAWRKAGGS
ncbi:minor tail protein [Mycobacterium Phage Niklas]|uniref:Minor tail protein n=1 Tax=Mycobacterium Phage Niklas TaxID=2517936 RepID=A0A482JG64_9CAUD|nr:minor tail protein [Mycobacterium Phage Niklas]ASR85910.1 minor tail protein [Mycobacterium phage Peanam]QAY02757.1 minor tail protein [Mycobacterium phage Shaobing]QBP31608.1 minor tail protein [Mycobacterium Phage Niklas]